jgi:hypothetical protein
LIKKIQIDNRIYEIDFFTGGDMKAALHLYGLNGPNSHHPCVYCKWKKNDIVRTTSERPLIFENESEWQITSRTLKDAGNSIDNNLGNGYVNKPLVEIEFDHFIVDLLHLYLR